MSDLKAALTETLREALASEHPFNGGTFPRWFRVWINEASENAADALLGIPGVAVIQLPKPTHTNAVSTSYGWVTAWDRSRQVRGEERLVTIDGTESRCMNPTEAREMAANLLAAAAAVVAGEEAN